MTGAQFEISIDGVPRTYRDRKDIALPDGRANKTSSTSFFRFDLYQVAL